VSCRLGRQAGWEPEAANGQHRSWPARPPPVRPPASSGCSQAFPSRCLAGRTWPCASCSTWSHRANPLTEHPACYLTLQREVLPQAGSHNQGCQMRTVSRAPRPQRACTGTLSGWRSPGGPGPVESRAHQETILGWDLRPEEERITGKTSTPGSSAQKDALCGIHGDTTGTTAFTCKLLSLKACLDDVNMQCTRALQGT
jgi:hypothetical protein